MKNTLVQHKNKTMTIASLSPRRWIQCQREGRGATAPSAKVSAIGEEEENENEKVRREKKNGKSSPLLWIPRASTRRQAAPSSPPSSLEHRCTQPNTSSRCWQPVLGSCLVTSPRHMPPYIGLTATSQERPLPTAAAQDVHQDSRQMVRLWRKG